jgi:hypothetical protein
MTSFHLYDTMGMAKLDGKRLVIDSREGLAIKGQHKNIFRVIELLHMV